MSVEQILVSFDVKVKSCKFGLVSLIFTNAGCLFNFETFKFLIMLGFDVSCLLIMLRQRKFEHAKNGVRRALSKDYA